MFEGKIVGENHVKNSNLGTKALGKGDKGGGGRRSSMASGRERRGSDRRRTKEASGEKKDANPREESLSKKGGFSKEKKTSPSVLGFSS